MGQNPVIALWAAMNPMKTVHQSHLWL